MTTPNLMRTLSAAVATFAVASCAAKGTLEGSRVETVRIGGNLYEVRVAPAAAAKEYRLLITRGTIVTDPDPQLENERNWNVVQPFMQRTCNGPFVVLDHNVADNVNLYIRFRCGT